MKVILLTSLVSGSKNSFLIVKSVIIVMSYLAEFASRFDVVVFVCGKKSSNGKVLFDVCHKANPRSYNIEEESELQQEWFNDCHSVGICGATSTPAWLMERVANAIRECYVG